MKPSTKRILSSLLATTALAGSSTVSASVQSPGHSAVVPLALSGATEVPNIPEPKDGILQGGFCTPDVHVFNKNQTVPGIKKGTTDQNHIVFSVNVAPKSENDTSGNFDLHHVKVYVAISDANHQVLKRIRLPLTEPPRVDPHTGTPFFVQCVWLHTPAPHGVYFDFPTGKYYYRFVAEEQVGTAHQVWYWAPNNNTFTITNS
ncbi:MAG: hypothetical protein K6T83_16470 [Alicyclobacillus sp.]|nr:hypothetical protein [Alicyclobacillus sp.]